MGHQRKLGSYGKNRIFWPKTEILGPKKGTHFLILTMFWPRLEKDLGQAMQAYLVPCWWVVWWLWRAGCILQDTCLLYILILFVVMYSFDVRMSHILKVGASSCCKLFFKAH